MRIKVLPCSSGPKCNEVNPRRGTSSSPRLPPPWSRWNIHLTRLYVVSKSRRDPIPFPSLGYTPRSDHFVFAPRSSICNILNGRLLSFWHWRTRIFRIYQAFTRSQWLILTYCQRDLSLGRKIILFSKLENPSFRRVYHWKRIYESY